MGCWAGRAGVSQGKGTAKFQGCLKLEVPKDTDHSRGTRKATLQQTLCRINTVCLALDEEGRSQADKAGRATSTVTTKQEPQMNPGGASSPPGVGGLSLCPAKALHVETPKGNTYTRVCTFPPPNFADLLLQRLPQVPVGKHVVLQLLPQGNNLV